MPEGHTVHRVARQLGLDLVGRPLAVSSPQGRFADGAARLDGRTMTAATAIGKQLLCEFDVGVLRVHLGLYGAWDLRGQVSPLTAGGVARSSLGAPRRSVRMGEDEAERTDDDGLVWPPPPVGAVRLRLATDVLVADLRGPSACELLTPAEAAAVRERLGPDPVDRADDLAAAGAAVVERVTRSAVPVGRLLMDQQVVAGIGNIYRAELLFRARLDPWTPGRRVPPETVAALWDDWAALLADGIRDGAMLTREDLDGDGRARALLDPTARHWVYGRAGLACRVCGTRVVVEDMAARKLYRCPTCQV